MNDNKEEIKNVINETLKNFSYLTDANTVVGTPVCTGNGSTVIPITKMTVAFLSGGGQYGEVKLFQPNKNYPSSTASGGVASVKPCGFLVEKEGSVSFLNCPDNVFDKALNFVDKVIGELNEK